MLAVRYRFHGRAGIKYVYRNGKTARHAHLTCRYLTNDRRRTPRISIVVSKKIMKSAVGRNRIRRRLYEAMRHRIPQIHPPGSDIVLIVTSAELRTCSAAELEDSVDDILAASGLYKTPAN